MIQILSTGTWSKYLYFQAEGEDELKKRQLMELAIINGTYRDSKEARTAAGGGGVTQVNQAQLVSPQQMSLQALRAATPLGFYGFLNNKPIQYLFVNFVHEV